MNTSPEKQPNALIHAIWASLLIAVIVAAFFAFRLSVNKAETLARELAASLERSAARFKTGTITQTFAEEIPVFRSLGVGFLEVSVSDPVPVVFSETDTRKILWDWVSLGQTVSEIRVPATYRYHVPLDGDWKLDVHDRMCIVAPPPISPTLPIAISTDRMEKKTSNGWARFDKQEHLDALERSITPRLNELANDPTHIAEARNKARETIANFVLTWLLRENQWGKDHFTSIIVVFPDEPPPDRPPRPTITLQPKL